jgi:nucleoside-diphosphate-sugar epimerase
VYGVRKEKRVTEKLSPVPISLYNKTKMIAERILLSFKNQIKVKIIRPATVCGLSPRMRFDLTVNLLTIQALQKKKITVLGGKQKRPNIHVEDLAGVFMHLLNDNSDTIFYNAGFENLSILEIAKIIKKNIPCEIKIKKSNDIRSYNLDSSKLLKTGFKPKLGIKDAIKQITESFKKKKISLKQEWYSVNWLKKIRVI